MLTRVHFAPLASITAAVALSACATDGATPEPKIVIQRVEVPVPVPCVVAAVAAPDFADTDAKLQAAPNTFERVKLLVAGRLQHYAYEGELRASAAACARPPG